MTQITEGASADAGEPEDPGMRGRLVGGFLWNLGSSGISQVSRVAIGILLARLLTPSDYGIAGMALVFSSLVLYFSDFSMGSALVQRQEVSEEDRSTVFWTSAAIGTFLTIAGVAAAGPLAGFYGEPRVKPLFMVVSISFLLVALQTTQASIMQREYRFRAISVRVAAGVIIGGIAGLVSALLGAGPWALIVQQVVSSSVSVVLLWTFSSWRPSFTFSMASLRDLGGFGVNLFGSRFASYVSRNADNVLVGHYLGPAPLGAYSVAYNLMFLPLDRLVLPIQDTLFPAYSRWQDDRERLAGVWLRVLRLVAAVIIPAMVGLAVVSPDFVAVVLGRRWHDATPVLQILCAVAIAQSLAMLGERALTAVNRTRTVLYMTLIDSAFSVGAFAVGLHWGIVGVAVCYTIVTIPLSGAFMFITIRALGISIVRMLRTFSGVTLAAATMGACCFAARTGLIQAGVEPGLRLPAVIAVGCIVYAGACALLQPQVVEELKNFRRRKSGAEPEDPAYG